MRSSFTNIQQQICSKAIITDRNGPRKFLTAVFCEVLSQEIFNVITACWLFYLFCCAFTETAVLELRLGFRDLSQVSLQQIPVWCAVGFWLPLFEN